MGYPADRASMSEPAAYLIHVSGWLDASWTDYFSDLSVAVSAPAGMPPETTLCGRVADQAALIGILARLNSLGATLLTVERLTGPPPDLA